jgi:hypothetical protein
MNLPSPKPEGVRSIRLRMMVMVMVLLVEEKIEK